jgi:hypothetical protein
MFQKEMPFYHLNGEIVAVVGEPNIPVAILDDESEFFEPTNGLGDRRPRYTQPIGKARIGNGSIVSFDQEYLGNVLRGGGKLCSKFGEVFHPFIIATQ